MSLVMIPPPAVAGFSWHYNAAMDAMKITAIVPTKRDPGRAMIKVGGKVVATLAAKLIAELALQVGQPWDDALARRVEQAARYDKAMRQAMQRLNRRPYSRRNLDNKLRDLGHEPPVRQDVLDRLESLNLLDDAAYGRALIREIQRSKPAGPRLLQQKLYAKGLDARLITQLLAEQADQPDAESSTRDKARALLARKAKAMQQLDAATRQRRLFGLLTRRGFDPDTSRQLLEELQD